MAITLLKRDCKTVLMLQKEFGFEISCANSVPASGAPNATVKPQAIPVVINSRLCVSSRKCSNFRIGR